MSDDSSVTRDSIAGTWEDSIRLLLAGRDAPVIDTDTGGATIELEGVLLRVLNPLAEPRVSERYVDLQLIADYGSLFSRPSQNRPQDVLTVADRLYAWRTKSGKNLDQLRKIVSELQANPTSRRAIAQVWSPEEDLPSKAKSSPSGHCFFYFSIRDGKLNMTASSRSVDAWNGELPNLLTLASLQQSIAGRLKIPVGAFAHFIISYHLYVRDLPSALIAFPEEAT